MSRSKKSALPRALWGKCLFPLLMGVGACGPGADGSGTGGGSQSSGGVGPSGAGGRFEGNGGGSAAGGTQASGGVSGGAIGGSFHPGGGSGTGGVQGGAASGGALTSGGGPGSGGAAGVGGGNSGGTGGSGDLCTSGVWAGETPSALELSGNTFAHDPTMIRVGDTYYRFWTGEFIPVATSKDLKSWSNARSVYGSTYPSWSSTWLAQVPGETFNFPWAPDVSEFGDQIHLYSSFSAKFGDNISCITHLTTKDIAGGTWTDQGPVICTEGTEPYNAIDADVGFDATGNPYFAFGSFWDGIFAFELNPDGSRKGTTLTRLAWASQIEAPVLFRRCGYYYLFVTWGLCCPGEGRSVNELTYRVAVGRSTNILGPYVDKAGKPMLEGGGTLIVQGDKVNWAAAGHSDIIVDGERIYHTYHAYRQSSGSAVLRIVPLFFDEESWPVAHDP